MLAATGRIETGTNRRGPAPAAAAHRRPATLPAPGADPLWDLVMNKRLNTPAQSRNLQKIVAEFLATPAPTPAPATAKAARAGSATGSYSCVWEYRVRPTFVAEFERAYGAEGEWVALFRRADGYLRTELHRDVDDPLRFITVDHWTSRSAHAAFQREFREDYAQLDDRCEAFTLEEWLIGDFAVRR